MINFFKRILVTLSVFWISMFLSIMIVVGIVVAVSMDTEETIKSNSILELNITQQVKDYMPNEIDPLKELLDLKAVEIGFNTLREAVLKAKNDVHIEGISIRNIPQSMGWAQLKSLRDLLLDFKESGKFIYSFNDTYSQKNYYLASVADKIYMSPLGYVELKGLSSNVLFFKDFEDKYGIKMEVIRHGKYKSAVEPFIASEMSPENRKQITELIQSLWKQISKDISFTRSGLNVEHAVNKLLGRNSSSSLANHLVDSVAYEDTYDEVLKVNAKSKKLHKISISDYQLRSNLNIVPNKNKVVIVYAQGDIIYGEGNLERIGQVQLIKTLRKIAKDKAIKSIVLRINSPGGSALASDLIWRELELLKTKKPIVVSMGNVAASGGYYIACNANKIIAEPSTITGSIGVFGMLPNATKFSKKIGINSETVSSHSHNFYYDPLNPITETFKEVTKEGVEKVYETFVTKVAMGRGRTYKQIDEIAQGRVWTGIDAFKHGLVDQLGGLDIAIAEAAELAELDSYTTEEYPKFKMDFEDMLSGLPFVASKYDAIAKELESLSVLQRVEALFQTKGVQAKVPFELDIQ